MKPSEKLENALEEIWELRPLTESEFVPFIGLTRAEMIDRATLKIVFESLDEIYEKLGID